VHLVGFTIETNSYPHFVAFYINVILVLVSSKLLMFLMASDFILLSTASDFILLSMFTKLYSIKLNIICYFWNMYVSSTNQLIPDIVTASSVVGWLHSNIWGGGETIPLLTTHPQNEERQKTFSETSVSIYEAAGRHVSNDFNFEVFSYIMVQLMSNLYTFPPPSLKSTCVFSVLTTALSS